MKKVVIIVSYFISLSYCAGAQTENYVAKIDSVKRSGYYNISISKEMNLHLKTDYSDLRLLHEDKSIPFALNPETDVMRETYLRKMEFSIAENNKEKTVLYANANAFVNITYNLLLTLETMAAERKCSLSGSNDQQNWTPIGDSLPMYPFPGLTKSAGEIRVGFPQSSYQFFRLIIYNNQQEPYRISGVFSAVSEEGYSSDLFQEVRMMQNPAARLTQKDSGGITYLKVRQNENFHYDRIFYQLTGPKYFNRKAEIYLPVDGVQSTAFPGKKYATFSIIDNASFNAKFPVTDAKEFLILVYNGQDTPFNFTGLNTSLNQRFITAYLDSGKDYQLTFGNTDVEQSPALITGDSIVTASLSFVKTGELTVSGQDARHRKKKHNIWLRWIFVSSGVVLLAFVGYKFFADINKQKSNDRI